MRLVKWEANWADEMDVHSFVIMSDDEYNKFINAAKNKNEAFEICVGTNEEVDYENGEDFLQDIKVKYITKKEAELIEKLFGKKHFGHNQFVGYIYHEETN